jgi:hypothetical protein
MSELTTTLWVCDRCGQEFLPGVLTHICGNTSLRTDQWQAIQRERDELRADNNRLIEASSLQAQRIYELTTENERLRANIEKGHNLVNDMDLRMPEQATEDADGWINSYRIPVGPWHRLLGWARGGW